MEFGEPAYTHKLLTYCCSLSAAAAGCYYLFTAAGERVTVNSIVTCGELTLVAANLQDPLPNFGMD